MPGAPGVPEALAALAAALPGLCDGWYLFGAQAVQVWGQPRLSVDVDVTVRLGSRDVPSFVAGMRSAGFELRVEDRDDFLRRTSVLPFVHSGTSVPVDVVLAASGAEEEFLSRARVVRIAGAEVHVISPEDLVVTKVLAGRPKDLEDVRGILRSRPDLDEARVRALLSLLEEALGQSDLVPSFEAQRRAVTPRR